MYRYARRRHGALNRDAVHDLFAKYGENMPNDPRIFIIHAKPLPAQEAFEVHHLNQHDDGEQHGAEITRTLHRAIENVRNRSEESALDVDTFLECCVNSDFKTFSAYSGISVSVLRKICAFTQKQIRNEYNRIS